MMNKPKPGDIDYVNLSIPAANEAKERRRAGSNSNNPELVDQAPEKMPEIVRTMHATAAQALEDAAEMLEHEMQSHIQLMRDEAATLRNQGDIQANTIEALSLLIRDTHNAFKTQAAKLASFRAGESNGTPNPPQDKPADFSDWRAPPSALSDELNAQLDRVTKELSIIPRGKTDI